MCVRTQTILQENSCLRIGSRLVALQYVKNLLRMRALPCNYAATEAHVHMCACVCIYAWWQVLIYHAKYTNKCTLTHICFDFMSFCCCCFYVSVCRCNLCRLSGVHNLQAAQLQNPLLFGTFGGRRAAKSSACCFWCCFRRYLCLSQQWLRTFHKCCN